MKNADITPIHKKGSKNLKDNYRPVSKIENIFSIFQCGFRKGFSTQHSLLSLIEKWKENVDKGKVFGALLTDLSKAFDCLSHKLLIAKLHAYGFDYFALKLVNEYLTNRKQRTKVNMSYGSWEEILFGVAQGSILGPLLFNIFLCDLFFELNNIEFASYADDNTPYVSGETIDDVIHHLEITSISLFKWFSNNQMKVNPEKCHFLLSTKALKEMKLDNTTIENSECEKLLGVFIDSDMSFKTHLDNICKKASNKIQALGRVTQYMSLPKKKLLFNSFFKSQFNYCPLVWMCHNRGFNNRINRLHERCLRITYNDKTSSFQELLEKDGSTSIHDHNLQILATEMFKVLKGISPVIISNIFQQSKSDRYEFRQNSCFILPSVNSVHNGTETIRYLGPKI